jgi:HEAT repeat protein
MRFILAGFIAIFSSAPTASAQVRDRAPRAREAAPPSDAAALASGWNAVAAKQIPTAVSAADSVLSRRPWDRSALLLKITALAVSTPLRALDAYEQSFGPKRKDDAAMLEPVAIGVLEEIATGTAADLKRQALTALSAARVTGAREALANLPADPQTAYEADAALARRGDAAAIQRLNDAAGALDANQTALARALRDAGVSGETGLLLLLRSTDRETRAEAARALGRIHSDTAREPLQKLQQDPDPIVRTRATVSLAQLGDADAMSAVERMLSTPVPDMQLAAAEAWDGRPGPWVSTVQSLLDDRDGTIRLQAARLIAPVDPDAARKTLGEALSDPNPVIRYESSRVLGETIDAQPSVADIAALRQRLRDADRAVRLQAASALLKLART